MASGRQPDFIVMMTSPGLLNITIGEAIRITAHQYPAHIALQDNQGSYTYSQLLHHSASITNNLLANNTVVGDRVVLLLDQGKSAVTAMLGVLDAGACFVPIDVKEPVERLQYIIQDCQPRCVITDSANLVAINNTLPEALVINIDDIAGSDAVSHQSQLSPDNAAYIFYTSGSTGNPKGVYQNHRNALHFANTYANTLGISHNDRLSMLYSMNFSASNMDIFSGLLRGATVCFYDLKNRGSAELEQWLNDEKISVLHTVPSVIRHLLNNTPAGHVYSAIRAIDLGGEAVYNSEIPLLKTFFTPECICFNHLAATEASVIAQHKIDTHKTYSKGLLPVGPAAQGMVIKVVNAQGENTATDEVGEIILESDFLSTGYWNLPEQTSKAFGISIKGKRYYRSGDLGFLIAMVS
jgi:non-ribosomal peptide synthetase component F